MEKYFKYFNFKKIQTFNQKVNGEWVTRVLRDREGVKLY